MKEPIRYSWPFQDITKKQRKKSDVSNPFQVNALFLHPLKAKIKLLEHMETTNIRNNVNINYESAT